MKFKNLIPKESKKIISRILCITALSVCSVFTFAQKQQVHLSGNNLPLKTVFQQLEKQTSLSIDYKSQDINDNRIIKRMPKPGTLEQTMRQLLDGTNCVATFNNGHVIIKKQNVIKTEQQSNIVKGTVVDPDGEPIIGANIVIKGASVGTITDMDGNFSLDVPKGAVLVVSYIGYSNYEIKIENQKSLVISLKEDNQALDEIVVVAYGTQKRKDLTGAITQIDSKVIGIQSASSATKALEGSVPGLQISTVDGQPGIDAGIRVRGLGSTKASSSNALVVIDGVPVPMVDDLNPLAALNSADIENITILKDAASTALYGSRGANGVVLVTTKKGNTGKAQVSFNGRWGVNSIGNFNFGTIDNAKDYYEYAWKSIYNSYRYGVDGTGLPQNWETNVQNPNHTHDEAALFASQHLFNYIGSETSFGRNMLGNFMAYDVPGAIYTPDGTSETHSATMSGAYLVNPDGRLNPNARLLYDESYADYLLENNFRQEYTVNVNGGNEKVNYFASLGYLSDPSYLENSKFERYSGRANFDARPFPWFKMGAQVSYTKTNTQSMAVTWGRADAGSNQGNVMRFVNGHAPIVPVHAYNEDGSFRINNVTGTTNYFLAGGTYSPFGQTVKNYGGTDIIYSQGNDKRVDNKDSWTSRMYGEISFLKDFKIRGTLAYDQNFLARTRYTQSLVGRDKNKGGMSCYNYNYQNLNTQVLLSYLKEINMHSIDAMAVHEFNKLNISSNVWGSAYEFLPGFISPNNFVGRYQTGKGMGGPLYDKEVETMESYLARLNYDYDDKYYLSGSIRMDGTSKFKKNRWGTFWSVGAGWRISSEKFMESTKDWLDNAKIRASYGVIGNANGIGRYSGYRKWNLGSQYTTQAGGTGIPNGVWIISMGNLVNDLLTWEETNTWDVGLDLSVLNSRITMSFDFYNRLTDNSFYLKPVSYLATGQTSLEANDASIRNRGIELEIGADIFRTKDFNWNLSLNGTHYTTKLVDLPEGSVANNNMLPPGTYEANAEGWSSAGSSDAQGGGFYLRGVGRDWYNLYIRKYAGVDQKTGLPQYWHRVSEKEVSEGLYPGCKPGDDIRVNDPMEASKYEVGSAIPKWIGGLSTSLRYKDFDFTAVLAFQLGGKFFSRDYAENIYRGSSAIDACVQIPSEKLLGNTWTPENTKAEFPMQFYASRNNYIDGVTLGNDWRFSDMALFSASYLRVKNITLGYTLPREITQKAYISNARVYMSGDNLFMFSAAPGIDPTMSLTGGMDVDAYS